MNSTPTPPPRAPILPVSLCRSPGLLQAYEQQNTWWNRDLSPLKDIRSIIIARCDLHAEPRLHMHHTLAFISAVH